MWHNISIDSLTLFMCSVKPTMSGAPELYDPCIPTDGTSTFKMSDANVIDHLSPICDAFNFEMEEACGSKPMNPDTKFIPNCKPDTVVDTDYVPLVHTPPPVEPPQPNTFVCKSCHRSFYVTSSALRYYEDHGFPPPTRCRTCREIRDKAYNHLPKVVKHRTYGTTCPACKDGQMCFCSSCLHHRNRKK